MTSKGEQAEPSPYPQQSAYPPPYSQPPGDAPPPPQMQPQQPAVVIVQQPALYVVQTAVFGPIPVVTTCPSCQQQVTTNITYETGSLTWIICLVLALVGCWLGCCLIPFCVSACKDVAHSCPNCHRRIGIYRILP